MKIFKNIFGYVEFNLTGGLSEKFLNLCAQNEIPISKIKTNSLGLTAFVPLRYYKNMHKIARRTRCVLRVKAKHGLYFLLFKYRRRTGLIIGTILLILMLNIFPQLVWTIQFYDFTHAQQDFLREQLYEMGIQEGALVSTSQLKTVQYDLFLDNEDYGWIKLNFVKGKLVVEKVDAVLPPEAQNEEPAAIVALCDGIIQKLVVEGGFIEKNEGQSVSEGDVIISALTIGKYDKLYTERAIAKVYAQVSRTYEITVPLQISAQLPTAKTTTHSALVIFGMKFKLPTFNAQHNNAITTVQYTPLSLFGMPLPATIEHKTQRHVELTTINYTVQQATDIAKDKIYTKISEDLPECEIINYTQTVQEGDDSITVSIEFDAIANIAKIQEGWNK